MIATQHSEGCGSYAAALTGHITGLARPSVCLFRTGS